MSELDLSCNNLEDSAAVTLAMQLSRQTLSSINLHGNYISDEGALSLLQAIEGQAIQGHHTVTFLDLSENMVSRGVRLRVEEALVENKKARIVMLEKNKASARR